MNERHDLSYYEKLLDDLGNEAIKRFDREQARDHEDEQGKGAFTFSALSRAEQAAILHALETNLPTKTARIGNYPTSYALKHAVERFTGFYCSNLQTKTAMRILGYTSSGNELNPTYNVSKREWSKFDETSREIANRRADAHRRIARQREAQTCARYFTRLTA